MWGPSLGEVSRTKRVSKVAAAVQGVVGGGEGEKVLHLLGGRGFRC